MLEVGNGVLLSEAEIGDLITWAINMIGVEVRWCVNITSILIIM